MRILERDSVPRLLSGLLVAASFFAAHSGIACNPSVETILQVVHIGPSGTEYTFSDDATIDTNGEKYLLRFKAEFDARGNLGDLTVFRPEGPVTITSDPTREDRTFGHWDAHDPDVLGCRHLLEHVDWGRDTVSLWVGGIEYVAIKDVNPNAYCLFRFR